MCQFNKKFTLKKKKNKMRWWYKILQALKWVKKPADIKQTYMQKLNTWWDETQWRLKIYQDSPIKNITKTCEFSRKREWFNSAQPTFQLNITFSYVCITNYFIRFLSPYTDMHYEIMAPLTAYVFNVIKIETYNKLLHLDLIEYLKLKLKFNGIL